MSNRPSHRTKPFEASPESCQPPMDEATLERQMRERGLSGETRRFLRDLHAAEKQLNDAFSVARQGGELEQRISQVYREMYGTD